MEKKHASLQRIRLLSVEMAAGNSVISTRMWARTWPILGVSELPDALIVGELRRLMDPRLT